jgi:hypothetical protein
MPAVGCANRLLSQLMVGSCPNAFSTDYFVVRGGTRRARLKMGGGEKPLKGFYPHWAGDTPP